MTKVRLKAGVHRSELSSGRAMETLAKSSPSFGQKPLLERAGAAALFAALVLSGCASKTPIGHTSVVTATTIVKQNADDAFVTHLTPQDVPALTQFKDQIATARTRADLVAAWKAIPALDAKGSDFLERRIFTKALEDGDWPSGVAPTELEPAFVGGVQQAVADFIGRGGH